MDRGCALALETALTHRRAGTKEVLTVYEMTVSQKRIRKLREVRRHSISLLPNLGPGGREGSGQADPSLGALGTDGLARDGHLTSLLSKPCFCPCDSAEKHLSPQEGN